MTTLATLVHRDEPTVTLSPTVTSLLIALLALAIVAVVAATALTGLRWVRARRDARYALPTACPHHQQCHAPAATLSPFMAPGKPGNKRGHRRTISITTAPSAHDLRAPMAGLVGLAAEKDAFLNSPTTAPPRPGVPEIHITFPDEDRDSNEKRHSGRVVVVRISENGSIGLAPYLEPGADGLPPYAAGEFMNLDLTRLGGLREKEQVFA